MFSRTSLLPIFLSNLATLASAQGPLQFKAINNCPITINLYFNSFLDSKVAPGDSVTRSLAVDSGIFSTDANGGNVNGGGAGFYRVGDSYYYYIVKDVTHFNTGIGITPSHDPDHIGGFCPVVRCDNVSCGTAFSQPPANVPPFGGVAPTPPLYLCPFAGLTYDITFCPSDDFPSQTPVTIHPNGNPSKCLDVRGAVYANGTPVQIYECNGTGAQKWFINSGSTQIRVANTNFCLDAGSFPRNGVVTKIWQCYDNLPAQEWHYTSYNNIMLVGTDQALDLPNGELANGNQVQAWKFIPYSPNQVWVVV